MLRSRLASPSGGQFLATAVGVGLGSLTLYLAYKRHQAVQALERLGPPVDFTYVLPEELILHIFVHLHADPIDLTRVALVCKEWHRFTKDDTLWKGLYHRRWLYSKETPLEQHLRRNATWHGLFWQRERVERKYFASRELRNRFEFDTLVKRGQHLLAKGTEQYNRETVRFTRQSLEADICLVSIAGEQFEGCDALKPSDFNVLELWGSTLKAHAELLFNFIRILPAEEGNSMEELWLQVMNSCCEKYEQANKLMPLSVTSLKNLLRLLDLCEECARRFEGIVAETLYDRAREYGLLTIQRANELLHAEHDAIKVNDIHSPEDLEEGSGDENMKVRERLSIKYIISSSFRALGTVCLHWAEQMLADDRMALRKGEERPQHLGELRMGLQQKEKQERRSKVDNYVAPSFYSDEKDAIEEIDAEEEVVIILKEARHYFLEALKLEEDDVETMTLLVDCLTLLGLQIDTHKEEEWRQYFSEGKEIIRQATEYDTENVDMLNQHGIFLTKQARKILLSIDGNCNTEEILEKENKRKEAEDLFDHAERLFLELDNMGVWFGILNLACLASLRGREDDAKKWLLLCHERRELDSEHLQDEDLEILRQREWFIELQQQLEESGDNEEKEHEMESMEGVDREEEEGEEDEEEADTER